LLALSIVAAAQAQSLGDSIAILPHDIVWKATASSPGLETAVTFGDPAKRDPTCCASGIRKATNSCRTSIPMNGAPA
jgi:hypothetical protein